MRLASLTALCKMLQNTTSPLTLTYFYTGTRIVGTRWLKAPDFPLGLRLYPDGNRS